MLQLKNVDVVENIGAEDFKKNYYETRTPLVIRGLSKNWAARTKWNWDYFIQIVGEEKVGIYNNIKSDEYTPVNKADEYVKFGDYIDMIRKGPAQWRIFLFNIITHAPQLKNDFSFPVHLAKGFVKRMPMLFVGGEGSVTHMHFDIDMSSIFHTQFAGRKRVLLFPFEEQYKLYRKPYEVLSLVDYTKYYDSEKSKIDLKKFPAVQYAKGFDLTLEHGDTLFMPAGYWHHMEYLESGFAISMRALNPSFKGKMEGAWNIVGMRHIDTLMKKLRPRQWYRRKEKKAFAAAEKEIENNLPV